MTGRKMREGECFKCGKRGPLAILCWDRSDYAGYCQVCARRFLKEQYAGMALRHERPDLYDRYARECDRPRTHVIYHGGGEWLEFDVPGGEAE